MTNYFENLDAILTEYRISYLKAYAMGDYLTGASLLYTMNSSHPPEAWLSDMPKFVIRGNGVRSKLFMMDKAKRYCDHWSPLLQASMAVFRQKNQAMYNQI